MFLKKLYRHNKWWCAGFVAFVAAFLFINIKWGVVASPVLQFGMYSGKAKLSDTLTVYKLLVNGQPLNATPLGTGDRDFVQTYLSLYPGFKANNAQVSSTLGNATGFYFNDVAVSAPAVNDAIFTNWFRQKVENISHQPVQQLEAFRRQYTWANGKLIPASLAAKLPYLDAH